MSGRRATSDGGKDPAQEYCDRLIDVFLAAKNRSTVPEFRRKQIEDVASSLPGDFWSDVSVNSDGIAVSLSEGILQRPQLQEYLSGFTTYTPSKWLLEQELSRRRSNVSAKEGNACALSWSDKKRDVYQVAADESLTGLCLSGGGVRSATFNLGILQGLASRGLLPHFDYLSSVSGGGYIHQWLAAWTLRCPGGLEGVQKQLIPCPVTGCSAHEPDPISWLRRYASYLTPQRAAFSADTWTMAVTWLRNTFLNQILLYASLGCVLLFFHLFLPNSSSKQLYNVTAEAVLQRFGISIGISINHVHWILAGCSALSALVALSLLARNFWLARRFSQREELLSNSWVILLLVLPGMVIALSLTLLMASGASLVCVGWSAGTFFAIANVIISFDYYSASKDGRLGQIFEQFFFAAGAVVVAAVSAGLFYLLMKVVFQSSWIPTRLPTGMTAYPVEFVIAPALIYAMVFLPVNLQLGILGRSYLESSREWIARFRAWTIMFSVGWVILSGIALLGPYLVWKLLSGGAHSKKLWGSLIALIVSHASALYSGASRKTDGTPSDTGIFGYKLLDLLGIIAAPCAIFSLLLVISYLLQVLIESIRNVADTPSAPGYHGAWLAYLLLLLVAVLYLRVDANEFSMHGFYRNRLARCYLGASREDRSPDPFTGFDERSELALGDNSKCHDPRISQILLPDLLPRRFQQSDASGDSSERSYTGPFPIFNCTLNLTFGEDLAYQERKGANFAFTPLYSGYHVGWTTAKDDDEGKSFNGFVPTAEYAYPSGVPLPMVAAISGAAMSPNQGYSTKASLAFLMTLFNVRLGWWIANPRRRDAWRSTSQPSPRLPLFNLLRELLGKVDDSNKFVYLSDGGKFDNMGLYELVRRRCRYIVISDAEQDGEMSFEGIAMAIRKCRTDFGAEITLNLKPLRLHPGSKESDTHVVVGSIKYPPPVCDDGMHDRYKGVVIYIKSSLTGDEPVDIQSYAKKHEAFPHDMTANQWFTESQFESYRRLGIHIVSECFSDGPAPADRAGMKSLFEDKMLSCSRISTTTQPLHPRSPAPTPR